MAKRKRMHGRILAVWEEKLGTELTADAAAGAKVLYVDDVSPFNDDDEEPGGWLQVGDQVIEYTTVDDDASTITLATGLTAAVTADGDEPDVWVWNDLYDEPDSVQWAQVMPDGKRDQGDAIEAIVSDSIDGLSNGDRGRPREGCVIERDGDEWELIKVRGRPSKARGIRWQDDEYVLTTADIEAGTAICPLSHRPMLESVDAKFNGLGQEPIKYTVDYDAQTVTWPLDGWEKLGDRLTFHYTFRKGLGARPAESGPVVDWQSPGWKYLQVPLSDSTDRSAPGFDDSSWATGSAPFGNRSQLGWPEPATSWIPQRKMWVRKTVTVGASTKVRVSYRIDNYVRIYLDGALVFGPAGPEGTAIEILNAATFTIPEGSHTLAVMYEDDATAYGLEGAYGDIKLDR